MHGPYRIDAYRTSEIRIVLEIRHVGVSPAELSANAPFVVDGGSTSARPLRIVAPEAADDLDTAVEAWLSVMRSRNKKASTISEYRRTVKRAMKIKGWSRVADLTYENVVTYLGEQRDTAKWKGVTYTRNLVCFRGLTRYLAKSKRATDDTLADAEPAVDDGDEGARAATTDEARLFIRTAWIRQENDARCKGNRALFDLCYFLHACRAGEPEQWTRKHAILDESPARIRWTKDIQKNGRLQEVVLAPELADLLRRHLAEEDAERAAAGLPPAGPDDPVFRFTPPRSTFRRDRDRAGIPAKDRRGRNFSAHSARKWFKGTLTAAGVATPMVEYLMRHTLTVEARYFDPSPQEQFEAVSRLPRLWPEAMEEKNCPGSKSGVQGLDIRSDTGIFKERESDALSQQQLLGKVRGPEFGPVGFASTGPIWPADSAEQPESPAGASTGPHAALIRGLIDPRMPKWESITAGSKNHVADLLEALAGLLRESASGSGQRTGRSRAG